MRIALPCLLFLAGCGGAAETSVPDAGAAPSVEIPPAPRIAPAPSAARPRSVAIPAGVVRAGSLPGTAGRRASREADADVIELGAFAIDRLPYPNDPLARPHLVASRAEAAALCDARGARLCTELEWERACESDRDDRFAGGSDWSADRCAQDGCASGFGVERLGETAPEWTSSDVLAAEVRGERTVVQRGGRTDSPPESHRCAARSFEHATGAPLAAFRCCEGAVAAPAYPAIETAPQFRDGVLDVETIRAAMRAVPELASYAEAFEPHDVAAAERALACGGVDLRALGGWELAPGPFGWSPAVGESAWVVSGISGGSTVIAVLHPLRDGRFAHGGSFVLEGESAPIAIARSLPERGLLQWSACWGRAGDGGVIHLDEDAVVRVISR